MTDGTRWIRAFAVAFALLAGSYVGYEECNGRRDFDPIFSRAPIPR